MIRARIETANALGMESRRLAEAGRDAEGLRALDDLLARFGDAPEPELRAIVAQALRAKLTPLLRLGDVEQAFATSDELVERFEAESEPAMIAEVGDRLLDAGYRLAGGGHAARALDVFERLMTRLADAAEPELRTLAARAQMNASMCLTDLGRTDEALASYEGLFALGEAALPMWDELAERAAGPDPALRSQLAQALLGRAITLAELDRRDEALAIAGDIVERFGADRGGPISHVVETARLMQLEGGA